MVKMKAVVIIVKTLASFIIYMRIVNTIFISKEQVVCHYVDLIVKVFEKILKLSRVRGEWGGGVECQLWISKSGVCLDQD